MLQAETIFDSTHAKIHIATSRGSSEIGRGGGEEEEELAVAARASARAANRRVCKCSTRGRDAVMEEKNCLFQRPAFYRPPLSAR